jgi:hypothetical protein
LRSARDRRIGITWLEILLAIFLCLCVGGLGTVLLLRHRENAQREQCKKNLASIGKAIQGYQDKAQGLPPSYIAPGYATWAVLLAPHLSADTPLTKWNRQDPYLVQSRDVREAPLNTFFCPARVRTTVLSEFGDDDADGQNVPGALGDYASVAGDREDGWTGPNATGAFVVADVTDRKDNRIVSWQSRTSLASLTRGIEVTIVVGEKHVPEGTFGDAKFGDGSLYNGANPASFSRIAGPGFPLATGPDAPFNRNFGSYHHGVCLFVRADSSVLVLANHTDELILGELARRTK